MVLGTAFGIPHLLRKKSGETGEKPTTVRVEKVQRGELIEVTQAPGEIEPRTKVSISARVSARIVELPFEEGQQVTGGNPHSDPPTSPSLLIRLDSNDLQASLRSAKAHHAAQMAQIKVAEARIAAQRSQLEGLAASLADTQKELRRETQLFAVKRNSQADLDAAKRRHDEMQASYDSATHSLEADEANLEVMKHNIEAAEADIVRAKDNLSYTEITSPIDGIVTKINAKVGELVMTGTMNNAGTVIMEVADLASMLLVARVDETDIARVQVGQNAKVHIQAYPERVFEGKVETIALTKSGEKDQSKHYRAEILLNTNGERIYSGLTADVDIETSRYTKVLKVPSQAVIGRMLDELPTDVRNKPEVDKKKTIIPVVYKYADHKAVTIPVKIGASDMTDTIIEAGLSEGDRIITGPFKILEKLKHDQKVIDETESTDTLKLKDGETTGSLKKKDTSAK